MRRLLVLAAVGTLAALAVAAPSSAKGPTAASLTGPGLGHMLRISGYGEGGTGTPLGALVQLGGFFPQAFGQSPDPTTRTQPVADLGPRYRVVYRVPGPSARSRLVQDVYPYAKPRPVTHMRAGQHFWGMRSHGGWFVGEAGLKRALVKAGLPESPPTASSSRGSFPWAWTVGGAVAAVVLAVLALRRLGITRLRALRSTTA
jgi:hypothetical protein